MADELSVNRNNVSCVSYINYDNPVYINVQTNQNRSIDDAMRSNDRANCKSLEERLVKKSML